MLKNLLSKEGNATPRNLSNCHNNWKHICISGGTNLDHNHKHISISGSNIREKDPWAKSRSISRRFLWSSLPIYTIEQRAMDHILWRIGIVTTYWRSSYKSMYESFVQNPDLQISTVNDKGGNTNQC
jgi:hypothetical protein